MTLEITKDLTLTDERAESSYGIPVLVTGGIAYGKSDILPAPWGAAGYDAQGNHTGQGEDKCRMAGVVVKNFAASILQGQMDDATFAFVKSFYA